MASWYDIIVAEEEARAHRLERMTDAQWKQEAIRIIGSWRGRDLRECITLLDRIDEQRAAYKAAAAVPAPVAPVRTERDVAFALWRDMAEEPEKYGEDIAQWLTLDAQLRAQPGHWRLDAYWFQKDAELEAKMAETAAVRIQAAVRGHQVRSSVNFRECCMCLAHRICPLETAVGMMCRDCAEQGPHEDITGCDDPWNWFRADYVDLAPWASDDEDSDPDDYIPEPRGERRRLREFPHRRWNECEWAEDDKGTCLWCGTTFKRPTSGLWNSGPNELGYCSDECHQLRSCWWRMNQAGVHGYPDLEEFAHWE